MNYICCTYVLPDIRFIQTLNPLSPTIMKTKTIIILCLFLGLATPKLFGQLPPVIPDGTKSIVWTLVVPGWEQYVSCDGVDDVLIGDVTFDETDLFKNGEIIRGVAHVFGQLTSINTGEVFTLHENLKGYLPLDEFGNYTNGTGHFNLVGDYGTHYIGSFSFFEDGTFTTDKAVCPGYKKNK